MTTVDFFQNFIHVLKRRAITIVMCSALVTIMSYVYYKSFKKTYQTYSKIFPLSINSSSGGSSLQSLKAQFGVTDKSDLDKIYNIIELVNSKNVSLKVVEQRTSLKQFPRIADWIYYDYNHNLGMFEKKIEYDPKDTLAYLYGARDILLGLTSVTSEKTEFYTITTSAHSKPLAQLLNEAILQQLSILYINMSTEKPRSDLGKIRFMRDSLNAELTAIERSIAGYRDSNLFASKYAIGVPQRKLERTRAEIEELYATTATAYQNAKFKLLSESPIFQVLDKPGEPFTENTIPAKKKAIINGILAAVLLSLLMNYKLFGQMIKDELSKD